MEAWRSLRGMPVYELPPEGHATHMYGTLVPVGAGPNLPLDGTEQRDRAIALVSFHRCCLVTLLAFCFTGEHRSGRVAIAWAALVGVDHRSGHYFAENRPDMTALFVGGLAVVVLSMGMERKRWPLVILGTACLVVGFFFKQTVSIFSAVPLIALFMRHAAAGSIGGCTRRRFPLVVMASVILGLGFVSPAVHYYMIAVQGAMLSTGRGPRSSCGSSCSIRHCFWFCWRISSFLKRGCGVTTRASLAAGGSGDRHSVQRHLVRQVRRVAQHLAARSFSDDGLLRAAAAPDGEAGRGPHSIGTHAAGVGTFLAVMLLMMTFPHLTYEKGSDRATVVRDKDYREALALPRIAGHCRLSGGSHDSFLCERLCRTELVLGEGCAVGSRVLASSDARAGPRGNAQGAISSWTYANTVVRTSTTQCSKALDSAMDQFDRPRLLSDMAENESLGRGPGPTFGDRIGQFDPRSLPLR